MSYGKAGLGLEAGGARNVAIRQAPPRIDQMFTRTDSGYWLARAGHIPSATGPKLWGSIPVELYEGHHPDPRWDVQRNNGDQSGLGYLRLGPQSATNINPLRDARTLAEQGYSSSGPYFEESGTVPAASRQPSAADVIEDFPLSIAGLDWRLIGIGALALYWFLRK